MSINVSINDFPIIKILNNYHFLELYSGLWVCYCLFGLESLDLFDLCKLFIYT